MVDNLAMPHVDHVPRTSRSQPHTNDHGAVHVCKRGDTLWDIARDHGVSLADLQKANPQLAGRGIFAGTQVHIPAKAAPATPRETPAPARRAASAEQQRETRRGAADADDQVRRRVLGADGRATSDVGAARAACAEAPSTSIPRRADGSVDVSATKSMTEAQKFDFYKALIAQSGGKFHSAPNARNLVGLRDETSPKSNGGRGANDDKFVMLWQDKSGRKHVKEFTGTTEGNEANRRAFSSDVNRDGRNDLGRIPLGHYEYQVGSSARLGDVLRPTKAFQVERDFNNDGRYKGRREKHADTSSAFLFHKGSSAGCQTMDDANWNRFWNALHSSGRPSKIGYTLVAV